MPAGLRRIILVGAPMITFAAIIAFITLAIPPYLTIIPHPAPKEPIHFDHSVHIQTAGLDCTFCHRTTAIGATAGYPEVQQCMFCHQAISQFTVQATGLSQSEAQDSLDKIRAAWQQQQPVNWERVHRMPDHVRFLHEAHINAGFDCATCHGDVGHMGQVVQVRTLNMGDCINCHRANNAPTECATCHK
jgi:Cytochrome c7 and related cytochrome c/Class III cytochrome C family